MTGVDRDYGDLSPDGRWLAYVSSASGNDEVYVTSYPAVGARTPISTDGGDRPVWSPKGREVLKPPGGKPRRILDPDRSMEFEWIVANRTAYRGRWVAVDGNKLLADAPSFAELLSRIQNLESVPLVHRID